MTEDKIIPKHEQDYWDTWSEVLPIPTGTVYDAKSFRKAQAETDRAEKLRRRNANVALATGRVNGKFVQHGRKRA